MRINKNIINLAIIFESDIESGGAFQQSLSTFELINNIKPGIVNLKFYRTFKNISKNSNLNNIESKVINLNFFQRLIINQRNKIINYNLLKIIKFFKKYNSFEKILIKDNIDIVYFLNPSSLALHLENLNYILTVWDLCHREDLEFPEVRINREFERREFKYKKILPKASFIIADSIYGKKNLEKFYSVDSERIHIIPFSISSDIKKPKHNKKSEIISTTNISKKNYLFYPAQFWSHKNHYYIIETVSFYEKKYNEAIDVVFTGGDKGNLEYVKSISKKYNLEKSKIHFLGFVDINEIIELYKNALCLFMPTYFGPMNIPPLEAFFHNTPVLYSNKKNMIEIFKDYVIPINLNNSSETADLIYKLKYDKDFYEEYSKKGQNYFKIKKNEEIIKEYEMIFEKYNRRRKLWR